jgi:catechol 2,3-dioxygenase-like lactoylglutathione lyase family enzyme
MTVTLDHTIVPATDKQASANFLGHVLDLQPSAPWGPFVPLAIGNDVTLDFIDAEDIPSHHYAFVVDETEFDPIFERIVNAGVNFYADPGRQHPGQINHRFGGRGVYFDDPDGHLMEVFSRPSTLEPMP